MAHRAFILVTIITVLALASCGDNPHHAPAFDQSELLPGGGITTKRLSKRSYIAAGRDVSRADELNFWTGLSLFRDPWVIAPSSTRDRDGLGPLFITRSCITCHHDGGRGPMSPVGVHKPSSLLLRLGSTLPNINAIDPNYGGQIQPRAIKLLHPSVKEQPKEEAWLNLQYESITGVFADGEPYQLQKPSYKLTKLAYGELAPNIGVSPRYAPSIYGMGLLDAISEQDLLAQEDIDDSDSNGISAKYNRVLDVASKQSGAIGRFGFKAKHPTLNQQVAAAFNGDIGITSPMFAKENCTSAQKNCHVVSQLGEQQGHEIPQKLLNLVNEFSAYIGVQPARSLTSAKARQGRELFYASGCADCHTPSYTTISDYSLSALSNQKIWPYTDLALHDMGPGLADGVTEFDANGREWRTPPLWGIGLQKRISGSSNFLHDGRARSINEAILWHGGEAEHAQQQYISLSSSQRAALLKFVKSI